MQKHTELVQRQMVKGQERISEGCGSLCKVAAQQLPCAFGEACVVHRCEHMTQPSLRLIGTDAKMGVPAEKAVLPPLRDRA